MVLDILIFLAAGVVGGAVNAAAGGAKLFVFPMLLATGLSPLAANVTQGVALWPAQLPAVWVYRKEVAREFKALMIQALPGIVGALAGSLTMVNSSNEGFIRVVPVLLIIAVGTIILGPRTTALMQWAFPGKRLKAATAFLLLLIGFYGGFFGAGLGFMLLAVLSASTGSGLGQVNGAKNVLSAAIQSVAVIPMMFSGLVDWLAAGCVLTGGLFGGYIGASLVKRLPDTAVRVGVAVLGLVLTVSFLLR